MIEISDEMVGAAAKAVCDLPHGPCTPHRRVARAALEAALPLIEAAVLASLFSYIKGDPALPPPLPEAKP